jgi:Dolichyl-phosphate-mannose-protein mannosyltransferase
MTLPHPRFWEPSLYMTRLRSRYLLTPSILFACTCIVAWFVLLFLYGWLNTFPATWHWDEAGKVRQILTGEWSFYHPQLLLTTARVVVCIFDRAPSEHSALIAGRWCSAVFSSSAIVVFALLASRLWGHLGGLFAIIWIGTGAFIFGLSHYFKEDPSLLFGLSLFCYFLLGLEEFPSARRALSLGIGAGLAASGKYVGLTVVPLGVLAVILVARRAGSGARPAAAFIAASLATFALFNLPALSEPAFFSSRFIDEIFHVLTEHNGFVSPITDTILLSHVALSCNIALVAALAFVVFRRNEFISRFAVAFLIIYPVPLLALIQLSVVKVERYVLPVIVLIQLLGACGLAELARSESILLRVASVAALTLGLAWNLWQLTETMSALRDGSRTVAAECCAVKACRRATTDTVSPLS